MAKQQTNIPRPPRRLIEAVLRVIAAQTSKLGHIERAVAQIEPHVAALAQENSRRTKAMAEHGKSGKRSKHRNRPDSNTRLSRRSQQYPHELHDDDTSEPSSEEITEARPIVETLTRLNQVLEKTIVVRTTHLPNDFSSNLLENRAAIEQCLSGMRIRLDQRDLSAIVAQVVRDAQRADSDTVCDSEFSPHSITALMLAAIGEHTGKIQEIKHRFLRSPMIAELIAERNAYELDGLGTHPLLTEAESNLIKLQRDRLDDLFDKLTEGNKSRETIDKQYANKIKAAVDTIVSERENPPVQSYTNREEICDALREELITSLPASTNQRTQNLHEALQFNRLRDYFSDRMELHLNLDQIERIRDAILNQHNSPDTNISQLFGDDALTFIAVREVANETGKVWDISKRFSRSNLIKRNLENLVDEEDPELPQQTAFLTTQMVRQLNPDFPDIQPKLTQQESAPVEATNAQTGIIPSPQPTNPPNEPIKFQKVHKTTLVAAIAIGLTAIADFFGIGKKSEPDKDKKEKPKGWLTPRNTLRALVLGGAVFLAVQASRGKSFGNFASKFGERSPDTTEMHL